MSEPSIKGTAFQSAQEDLHRLVDAGRIPPAELEARLRPEDRGLLEQKINPAAWYPIATYVRMVDLLVAKEAGGDREGYLVERGRRAAERLAKAGIYQQLDASVERSGPGVGRIIVTLASAIYSFTRWRFVSQAPDGGGAGARGVQDFRVEVDEASEFPEVARFTAQGFIEYAASRTTGRPYCVTSGRPARDRVVFEATRKD